MPEALSAQSTTAMRTASVQQNHGQTCCGGKTPSFGGGQPSMQALNKDKKHGEDINSLARMTA